MPRRSRDEWRPFEVVGLEIEYPLVDRELRVRSGVGELLRRLRGRPTSSVELGSVELSNELTAHVVELKTPRPVASLRAAAEDLFDGLIRTWEVLEGLDLGFLPTGMHPTMLTGEGELWQRAGRAIYETYSRIFDIRQHGWLNVQSCHVNLPLGSREEAPAVHNALVCLLPYLPALAASSPVVEGRAGSSLDMRMEFYRVNQERLPSVAGEIVPEFMESVSRYRREVLGGIYRELDAVPDSEPIRREFVNSRGVIPKFSRASLEVRVLDAQECVRMDAAVAAFVRGAGSELYERLRAGETALPPHRALVDDFGRVVREGRRALVQAPHLGGPASAGEVLAGLLDVARERSPAADRELIDDVAWRLETGSLAERILEALDPDREGRIDPDRIREVYGELVACLRTDAPWRR